jgi:hypothetical protein
MGSHEAERAKARKVASSREAASGQPDDPGRAGSGRGRPVRTELDARQLQAIHLYLADPNKTRVAEEIGVALKTLSRWFQNPVFLAEYRRQLDDIQLDLWTQLIAAKDQAWEHLLWLMIASEPRVSIRATTWLLDRLLSSPSFLDRSVARRTGLAADLEDRELELLELVAELGRGDADRGDAHRSDDERQEATAGDPVNPEDEREGDTE